MADQQRYELQPNSIMHPVGCEVTDIPEELVELAPAAVADVEFEIVGLQMYYPEYDLFEIDRLLDRYAKLGKPIHITEMGCSSAPGIDPNGMRKKATAGWHGPWTEEMQADWVEGVYTICYSKPYIQGIAWWDLADAVSFWPYGGLLRGDLSPKPAYLRLKNLVHSGFGSKD